MDCWIFGDLFIQQTFDGLVIIERTMEDKSKISIKSSPSNGKIRLDSDFVQVLINYLWNQSPVHVIFILLEHGLREGINKKKVRK